jgi:hypothetical protein
MFFKRLPKTAIVSLLSSISITQACQATALLEVGEFRLEEVSGGGCGMTLSAIDTSDKNLFVLFNGLDKNSMTMKINGKVTKFKRVEASGEEFYGQLTSQTFRSADGIQVHVVVKLGKQVDETIEIKVGTIRVEKNGQRVKLSVVGLAGC